ncbi:hypothetical protein Tco_1282308 [Tanacetum coccineum]
MKEEECNFTTVVSEHLNEQPTSQDELSHKADSKTRWCKPVRQEHEKRYTFTNDNDRISLEWEGLSCTNWVKARYGNVNDITKERILENFWNNKLKGQTRDKSLTEEQKDPKKCGETKERAIIMEIINKLPNEWFSEVSRDKDDLEVIIDYIEPIIYDGFIDHIDEAYKQRRNKLLRMPYTEPPPIIKEETEITKYNLRAGEVFTKTKILNIKGFPRTAANIVDIRADIINDKNSSLEDLSNTKRRHWCKPIYQWKEDICAKWDSCNPYFDECDGGDNHRENKEYWESSNDDIRTTLEWENLNFDNWVRVAFGKNPEAKRQSSRPAQLIIMCELGDKEFARRRKYSKDFRKISNFEAMLREFLEKCHFMVKEGIVLGHKVSEAGLEVDKAKVKVISKLPPPTNIKGIRSFLGHASFYRRFIKDFSKITRLLTKLLEKDTPFEFNDECHTALKSLKAKLTCAPMMNKVKFHNILSFASVTNGIARPTVDTSSTNANIQALVLDDQGLINVEDPFMVLFVKLKDVNSMSNWKRISDKRTKNKAKNDKTKH